VQGAVSFDLVRSPILNVPLAELSIKQLGESGYIVFSVSD
jgi:hypothetical protein